jgi:hypothetical protein
MVDALNRVRRWLKPGGILLDARPTAEPVHLEVRTERATLCAGDLQDAEDGGPNRRHARADAAMMAALARGWFDLEARVAFTYRHHADSVRALQNYVDAKWKDAHFDAEAWRRASAFVKTDPDAELWLNEQATMSRLRPLRD